MVLFFTVVIFTLGALAVKSPNWANAFRHAAEQESWRRGLESRKLSQSELLALERMLGPELKATDKSISATLDVIQALTGLANREGLARELDERSQLLLQSALSKQFAAVKSTANLTMASRIWLARRYVSEVTSLIHGLKWFLPLCFAQIRPIGEKYLATATFLGVWCGLLYWGFTNLSAGSGSSDGPDWLNIVGVVITLSAVLGLVLAVYSQFKLIAGTGTWQKWALTLSALASSALSESDGSPWFGGAIFVISLGYMVFNALRWARLRWLKTSERIGMVGVAVVLLLIIAIFGLVTLNAPPETTNTVILVFGTLALIGGALYLVTAAVEWSTSYRALQRAELDVPRRGFRWWALWSWVMTSVGMPAADSALRAMNVIETHPTLFTAFSWAELLVMTILSLAFIPGVVISYLFVRRVNKEYQRLTFVPARTS